MFEVGSGPTVALGTFRAILVILFRIWENKLLLLLGELWDNKLLLLRRTLRLWDNELLQLPGEL